MTNRNRQRFSSGTEDHHHGDGDDDGNDGGDYNGDEGDDGPSQLSLMLLRNLYPLSGNFRAEFQAPTFLQ